jgi:hypothetical protein
MAFVTTKFGDVVSYKVAYHSSITRNVTSNLTGSSGTLYSVKIVNGNDAAVYVKLANAFTATGGSTAPDWIFPCAASSTQTYEIPGGVAFDALSVWATENPSPSDNTTPSISGNEAIAVTIITGN